MSFSNFWGMALISTIKISICDYGKGKKISVLIWHLVHDVDYIEHNDFKCYLIILGGPFRIQSIQSHFKKKKRFTNRPLYTTATARNL